MTAGNYDNQVDDTWLSEYDMIVNHFALRPPPFIHRQPATQTPIDTSTYVHMYMCVGASVPETHVLFLAEFEPQDWQPCCCRCKDVFRNNCVSVQFGFQQHVLPLDRDRPVPRLFGLSVRGTCANTCIQGDKTHRKFQHKSTVCCPLDASTRIICIDIDIWVHPSPSPFRCEPSRVRYVMERICWDFDMHTAFFLP